MKYYRLYDSVLDSRTKGVIAKVSPESKSTIKGFAMYAFFDCKKYLDKWDDNFQFFYDKTDKKNLHRKVVDTFISDLDWFVVSERFKNVLSQLNTELEFFPVKLVETSENTIKQYYAVNVLTHEEAICLELSDCWKVDGLGYTFAKYGIYEDKTNEKDLFNISYKGQMENVLIVSERAVELFKKNKIVGYSIMECKSTTSK